MNKRETEERMEYPLSDADIQAALEPDTKIYLYEDLEHVKDIDQLFDKEGRCVVLFPTEAKTNGHWVCMFKRKRNRIDYFDSYGVRPDGARKWLTEKQLDKLGADEPYLSRLLKHSNKRVYYNTHPFQEMDQDVATCGRWVVARLMCKDLTPQEFYDLVHKSGMKPDEFVTKLTYEFLGK